MRIISCLTCLSNFTFLCTLNIVQMALPTHTKTKTSSHSGSQQNVIRQYYTTLHYIILYYTVQV
jgi:hypothetical protein